MKIENPEELLELIRSTPSLTDEEICVLVQLSTNTILLAELIPTREKLIEELEDFFTRYQNNERPIFIGCDLSVKNEDPSS